MPQNIRYIVLPVFVDKSLTTEVFKDNFGLLIVYQTVSSWCVSNEIHGRTKYLFDGKYYTRLSYSKFSQISYWNLNENTVKKYLTELEKMGLIERRKDNYRFKYGNLYTYTDKIFDYITKDEFYDMTKKHNSTFNESRMGDDIENMDIGVNTNTNINNKTYYNKNFKVNDYKNKGNQKITDEAKNRYKNISEKL